MLAAGMSFALMSVFVKQGSLYFSSHEMVFYRSLLAMAFLFGLMRLPGAKGRPKRTWVGPNLGLQVRRGVIGFIALATFFYAVAKLPMSVAVTLNYSSPLFLALVMPFWLGERSKPLEYLAVALGFIGIALLLRPWEGGGDLFPAMVGLFSGFMAALAYVHVRQLGKLDEPEWRTVFWFAVVGLIGAALLSGATGWHAPRIGDVPLLLALGVFATFGQLAMTRAYRRGDTVVVASLAYSTVVFSSLLDVVIWKLRLPPIAWAGMALTIAAGVWAVRLNMRKDE
jgi:drug/metabolite transporter (DMT)-like permease